MRCANAAGDSYYSGRKCRIRLSNSMALVRNADRGSASIYTVADALLARRRATAGGRRGGFPWEDGDWRAGIWTDCRKSRCAPDEHMRSTAWVMLLGSGCKWMVDRGLSPAKTRSGSGQHRFTRPQPNWRSCTEVTEQDTEKL